MGLFLQLLVMPDDFTDDEGQEFLGKFGVEVGLFRQSFQPLDLPRLARRIGRGKVMRGLEFPHGLRVLEPLGQRLDQNGLQPVDGLAMLFQDLGGTLGCVGHAVLAGWRKIRLLP